MSAKKTTTKKPVATHKGVKMISYSIKMTIPTGPYANIQPEIVVKAGNPEDAHKYVAPHMNKLWREYFMISERRNEVIEKPKSTPEQKETPKPKEETVTVESSPVSDTALVKATQAIQSCMSSDALDLIIKQIGVSTKLTEEHKKSLLPLVEEKSKKLNG
jgi:hypothetical protein